MGPTPTDIERQPRPTPGDVVDGLTSEEAARRLEQYGPNEVPEPHPNPILAFLSYFWGPIPWMIEVALVLSAAVRHWVDAAIVGVLLSMNGVVAFWEEHQAANAIAALKQRLAGEVSVRRDGKWQVIPSRDVVPGDLVRLRLGDVVPADARLHDEAPLEVDQSALTGESLPVEKGDGDLVYAGSIVARGETDATVEATGPASYFGRTTELVETAGTVSHFQRAVLKIGNYLIVIALVLVSIVLAVSLLRGEPVAETLVFALVVTVAAVPVALPAVLSVTMAVGAGQLARQEAVVSHLPAVEELGGIDTLCSDKTGTLTQNQLTAAEPAVVADGVEPLEVLRAAALASRVEDRDPIDLAVLRAVGDHAATPDARVTGFRPFDPVVKRSEADVVETDGAASSVCKGAPQVVVGLTADPESVRPAVDEIVDDFASRGYRSLGVARRCSDGPWEVLGVLPLYDPPRDDSRDTIAAAEELGIDVKMVTGDQVAIGKEIARQVGLGSEILDAAHFDDPTMDDERLEGLVQRADGFAQVFPEHKYRIVKALQSRGHLVAMTGDGVNDAPALKQADAGIAVAGSTDAARAAADVVLLTPGLSVIVAAIRLARQIFQRMTSYAIYRIAETIRILLLITAAILAFNFFPVTAVMIVLLAVLNDGAILSIAYDNATASSEPETWRMPEVLTVATALGVVGVIASFGIFFYADRVLHLDHDLVRSLMYLKLSVAGHLTIFVARTRGRAWTLRPAGILVAAVLGTQAVATVIAAEGLLIPAIGWIRAGWVWAYALSWFLVNDQVKVMTYRWLERRERRRSLTGPGQPDPATAVA